MNKKQLIKPFQDLKQEIEKLRKKHLVQGLVDKFHVEKKYLEGRIEKTVTEEVKKAMQDYIKNAGKISVQEKKERNLNAK